VLVGRPLYTKQEYLSLARKHQNTSRTTWWDCGRSTDFIHVSLDFRRTSQASPYSSIDAQHQSFRYFSPRRAGWTQHAFLATFELPPTPQPTRITNSLQPQNELQVAPTVSFAANRGSLTHCAKKPRGLLKFAGLAGAVRTPRMRNVCLPDDPVAFLAKSRILPVARSGRSHRSSICDAFSVPIFTPRARRTQKYIAVPKDCYERRDTVETSKM
jgi:hypothetical protein